MTKVLVDNFFCEEKEENYVEFVKYLTTDGNLDSAYQSPTSYDNIKLIYKSYLGGDYDLIMGWDDGFLPKLYLGHWNDGVVE